jgi:hypothetical protein
VESDLGFQLGPFSLFLSGGTSARLSVGDGSNFADAIAKLRLNSKLAKLPFEVLKSPDSGFAS